MDGRHIIRNSACQHKYEVSRATKREREREKERERKTERQRETEREGSQVGVPVSVQGGMASQQVLE